jgi:hypothetical protein
MQRKLKHEVQAIADGNQLYAWHNALSDDEKVISERVGVLQKEPKEALMLAVRGFLNQKVASFKLHKDDVVDLLCTFHRDGKEWSLVQGGPSDSHFYGDCLAVSAADQAKRLPRTPRKALLRKVKPSTALLWQVCSTEDVTACATPPAAVRLPPQTLRFTIGVFRACSAR